MQAVIKCSHFLHTCFEVGQTLARLIYVIIIFILHKPLAPMVAKTKPMVVIAVVLFIYLDDDE